MSTAVSSMFQGVVSEDSRLFTENCVCTLENSYGRFGGDFCLELQVCPFKISLTNFSESLATSNNLYCTTFQKT
jgi:hypothetical protein